MRTLVVGWFSFENMGATAGDLYARDLVHQWLAAAGIPCDVAQAPPFEGGVDWREVSPADYSQIVFVCGPFGNGPPLVEFLDRFQGVRLVGLNLSMLQSLDDWNPFEVLFERDSSRTERADMCFLADAPSVPVIGVCLANLPSEYKSKAHPTEVNQAILDFLESKHGARVTIDTRLDVPNKAGLRTAQEVDSLFQRMDVVLTSRLHGTVLSLKNGVPVVSVDPVAGGGKISHQARVLGWPAVIPLEELSTETLNRAYDFCLSEEGRARAAEVRHRGRRQVEQLRDEFVQAVAGREP